MNQNIEDSGLDERKIKILLTIIENYLETGEPVGSRTISKNSDLNLSSATIRNEMSDLEELGFIVQPHTSAGRIPSDKGYRFYVNRLMEQKDKEVAEFKEMIFERTEKLEKTLKSVVKTLANNTQYTTLISAPSVSGGRVKFVQLSAVDEEHLLAVVVMDQNLVNNKMLEVDRLPGNEDLLKLNMLLNTHLNGLSIQDINLGLITALKSQAGEFEDVIEQVMDSIAETIREEEELEIYTSGATNIFKYPELSDTQRASELLTTLEEKESLMDLLHTMEDETEESTSNALKVYIGEESPVSTMKDCSVVTTTYDLGNGIRGTVGIIGPKRMDYKNVMDSLKHLTSQLDQSLNKKEDKK